MTDLRILNLTTTADTGGQGWALREALAAARPGWTVDAMRRSDTWIRYPFHRDWDPDVARELWAAADVVHLRESPDAIAMLGAPPRPLVVHHHGTRYRRDPAAMSARCQAAGAIEVASTLDLVLAGGPHVRWLPGVVDVEALEALRAATFARRRGRLRIYHSPTNRVIKGTDDVVRAVTALRARGLPVELELVERLPYADNLGRKAGADIVVDQLVLGYGLNAIEAWAMGIPVVAGVVDPAVRAEMVRRFGVLPFVEATPQTLERVLERLVRSPTRRARSAAVGRAHVERFHSQAAVVDRLEPIYRDAIERRSP